MLAAAQDAVLAESVIEGARIAHHLLHIVTVTTAAEGIVGVVIKGDVEHRTEVHIEAEHPEQTRRDLSMPADQLEIAFVPELVRIRRLIPEELEARDAAAFLVDGDDR